jgi:two-component system, OmpR family, sensor kinase
MIFNSIRWRLQAWHGLILVLVLAAFGFTAYQVAWKNQLRRIDQELDQRSMGLFRPDSPARPPHDFLGPPHDGSPGGPRPDHQEFAGRIREAIQHAGSLDTSQTNGFYYVFWGEDGSVGARSAGAPEAVPPPQNPRLAEPKPSGSFGGPGPPLAPITRTRAERRELFRFLPRGECIVVGHSMTSDLAAMRRLALWLVTAGVGVMLFGLAGGWWLATRAIRPIEDISATAVKIAAGDLSQRINVADTDSELGRLAGILNSTFARLEAAFAHQARFTSDASHELRTPVSVILSQTQSALSRERAASEYREALEACQRAAQRMRALTESLLELARLDAGQEPMEREPFDLSQVARECVEFVRPLAAQRGIELRCELPAVPCYGDAERIIQVVTNLLTNAIQFNHDQGQVRVSVRAENGGAILTVSDTGEGIPADDLPHVFERFYRVDKSRSRAQNRTGLGLAISKAIIEAHGGNIEAFSRPGSGSTFTVRLPPK